MSGHTLLLENSSGLTAGGDNSGHIGSSGASTSTTCNTPQQQNPLSIYLHGGVREVLPKDDMSRSVEEVMKKLLIKHYPKIGPAAINLFGLALLNVKRNDRFIWKSQRCLMKDLQARTKNDSDLKLFIRVRFMPAADRLGKLNHLGGDVIVYLHHQLKEDLLTERMKNIYGSRNQLSSAKCRGLAVLNLLITSRQENRSVEYILEQLRLKDCLPPSECVAFLKKIKLKKNMKDHLKIYDRSHPADTTQNDELMFGYVRDILKEIMDYMVEQYDAKVFDMNRRETVERKILIDIHHQPSGVFIGGDPFSPIEELCSASSRPTHLNPNTWNVHLNRTNGRPEVLEFESEELADSFVSCLEGYFRLIHNYYFSLCKKMEPLSVQSLDKIKSHGPIETECAMKKLKAKSDAQEFYYLCKQDIKTFDQYTIVYMTDGQIKTETVQQGGGLFHIERYQGKTFADPGRLVQYLMENEHRNVLASTLVRLKPKGEACKVLKDLFVEEVDDSVEDKSKEKEEILSPKQASVISDSQIKLKNIKAIGSFTEVRMGTYNDDRIVAIKSLRTRTTALQLFQCFEPFQYSLRQHLKFQDSRFFASVLGVCMTTPIRVVMDYAPEGSLSLFFMHHRTDQPIYLRHLMYVATQVAQALYYMEEERDNLHHGNICCRNILVFRYDLNDIYVKLADPGMVKVYEQLPLSHPVNKKRIPWIAPELFDKDKRSSTNIKSDIYAFGTTIWEMFEQGNNPVDMPPLSSMPVEQHEQFFRSPDHKLPEAAGLKILKTDSQEISKCKKTIADLMRACRGVSPYERPDAKEVVRDLHTLTSSYAGQYHDYDSILEEDYPLMMNTDTSLSQDHDSDEVPDITGSISGSFSPGLVQIQSEPPTRSGGSTDMSVPTLRVNQPQPNAARPSKVGAPPRRPLPQQPQPSTELSHAFLINFQRLEILGEIGQGHYGKVKKGYLYKTIHDQKNKNWTNRTQIAAKCLKSQDFITVLRDSEFRHEAEIMATLRHENIVQFFGICDDMIIMEYVENGCMSGYLRKQKKVNNLLSVAELMKLMLDVAAGMEFMAGKRIIHSDLAGRNILMTKDLRAKISDFGLARNLSSGKDYYRRSKERELPASWCSPEGLLTLKFTTSGDVWSYGVVLWEAFTHGKRPEYKGDLKKEGQQLILIEHGERLNRPDQCPDKVWDLMMWCWKWDPKERPNFHEVHKECREILSQYCIPTPQTNGETITQHVSGQAGAGGIDSMTEARGINSPAGADGIAGPLDQTKPSSQLTAPNPESEIIVSDVITDLPTNLFTRTSTVAFQAADSHRVLDSNTNRVTSPGSNLRCLTNHRSTILKELPSINVNTALSPEPHKIASVDSSRVISPDTSPVSPSTQIGSPADRRLPLKPRDNLQFLLSSKDLAVDSCALLGQGEFGAVFKGTYKKKTVAVKVMEACYFSRSMEDQFWEEVDVFGNCDHANIVNFLGYIKNSHMLVMEFVPNGSLYNHLILCKHRSESMSLRCMLGIMNDIAFGMSYLVEKKIIHCDLAARNILLTEFLTAKISDFGLSKALGLGKEYYRRSKNKKMPCWWCAPEVLHFQRLSHQSDVWSYGITCWEIFTYGEVPNICKVDGKHIVDLIHIAMEHMKKGFRLEKPDNCPQDVYEFMLKCWEWEAENRPQFSEIHKQCLAFLDKYGQTAILNTEAKNL